MSILAAHGLGILRRGEHAIRSILQSALLALLMPWCVFANRSATPSQALHVHKPQGYRCYRGYEAGLRDD